MAAWHPSHVKAFIPHVLQATRAPTHSYHLQALHLQVRSCICCLVLRLVRTHHDGGHQLPKDAAQSR
eukprot:4905855-Amphidinium_carterae.2